MGNLKRWSRLLVLVTTTVMAEITLANPVLDNVAAGQVTVSQVPNSTVVNQSSQKAIINWQSFNIGASEKTHFQQPAGGIALNRISPTQGASQIYGQLTATGKIILVNQAGIFFGPGSRVDVGGMIASTSDISDANFLAGKYHFDKPSQYNGSIINQGSIRAAEHGLVALVGSGVRNDGTIEAHMGNVVLASGNKFTVDLYGDQLVNFTVDEAATSGGVDHHGNKLTDAVRNDGSIVADGGRIIMTAKVARGVVDNVVNMRGVAQARSVSQKNGVIILGADDGNVRVSGKVDVSGQTKYARGGKVKILAKHVHIEKTAVIDASGDAGGGEVLIGGNYQGKGPEQNAYSTRVDKGALINADAITEGDGGRVIVWADNDTGFYGNISARGGLTGGDGGFVETSGKKYLDVLGARVDLRAPLGKTGTWLLDPENLTIQAAGTTTASFASNTYTSNVDDSILTVADLEAALASANIVVTTGAGGAQAGNITVADPVTWSSTSVLTLSAINNIVINAAITALDGGLTLSAVNAANSITTGSAGAINVKNFILSQGEWTQTSASNPAFSVSNNFQIATGFVYNSLYNAKFIRNSGTTSIGGFAYDLITDVYGLQGIGTQSLAGRYALANNIDASVTLNWLGNPTRVGAQFVPISTLGLDNLTGSFDGQGYVINNLYMTTYYTGSGLFGMNSGTVSNVGLTNITLTGTDFNGGIAALNSTTGIIQNSFVTGSIAGAKFIGGLVGFNDGLIQDSYSLANITVSNASVGSGGLVGEMSASGVVQNSYSAGYINTSGFPLIGGLIGGTALGTVTDSYWDTQTSGKTLSQGGGTAQTTTQLQAGLPAGFSGSTWGIISGTSYPYLLLFYPTTPRVVSGFVPGGSTGASGLANSTVQVAVNGTNLTNTGLIAGTSRSMNNGYYYFLEPTGAVADNGALITYLTGSSANAVTEAPGAGNSITGLTMTANTVTVGDDRTQTLTNTNALLSSAKGGLSSNILYTTSGSDLTLNSGISLASTATTTYDLDGNITASGTGNVTFASNVLLAAASPVISVVSGNITFNGNITGVGNDLTLTGGAGSNTFTLTNNLSLDNIDINGGSGTNTLVVQTSTGGQNWDITALDTGAIGNTGITGTFDFTNIQNLTGAGGGNTDTFTLSGGGTLSGAIDGGSGSNNTITADNVSNTWNITGADAGNVTGIGSFSNIDTLNGGSNDDSFVLNGGSISTGIVGNGGTNTLTGNNISTTWLIGGTDTGEMTSVTFFDGIQNLVGGSGADSFILDDGRLTGSINGGGGNNTLTSDINRTYNWSITGFNIGTVNRIDGGFINIQNLVGGGNTDNFTLNGGTLAGSINGNGSIATLTGNNIVSEWMLTGADTGTVTGLGAGFSNIQNLTGGSFDDAFRLVGGTLSGTIDGGGGSGINTINTVNGNNTWNITGADTGNVTGINHFDNIGSLIGGSDDDNFVFNGGSISNSLSGGSGGTNTIIADNVANAWIIDELNSGNVTEVPYFNEIQNLVGGSDTDIFTLSGNGALSGTINGSGGTNTLVANNVANTWSISGSNTGTVTGVSSGFSNIQNIDGGTDTDLFVFGAGGSIAGGLNGGSGTGANTADFSLLSSALSIALTGTGTSRGFAGTSTIGIGTSFDNIDVIAGTSSGNNNLTATNSANAWSIDGINSGSLTSTNVLGFSDFQNLIGGTSTDSFTFSDGATIESLDGGSGTNSLNFAAYSTPVSVNLQTSTATGIGTPFNNIGSFTGNGSNGTLTGTNGTHTFNITANNSGNIDSSTTFLSFGNLVGGTGTNTFAFTNNGSISGIIDGGNLVNTNMLDFSGYAQPIDLALALPTGNEFNSGTLSLYGTSSQIGSFIQVQAATGTADGSSRILLPSSKSNISITYTNPAQTDGFIGDPFYFFNMVVVTQPAPAPQPSPVIPTVNINGNTVIQGTTAYIVNEDNMDVTEEGIDSFNNAATESYGVNVNIGELIQQQNQLTLKLAQETKFGCMQ